MTELQSTDTKCNGCLHDKVKSPFNPEYKLPYWMLSKEERSRHTKFWLTPNFLYDELFRKYGPFDYDPCPYPIPDNYNGLEVDWGKMNYVNPPFRKKDGLNNKGPTAFVHKAISEYRKGNGSVIVLPVPNYVRLLLEAGAQIVPLGRVSFEEVVTGEPQPSPSAVCAFILKAEAGQ